MNRLGKHFFADEQQSWAQFFQMINRDEHFFPEENFF